MMALRWMFREGRADDGRVTCLLMLAKDPLYTLQHTS